MYRFFVYVLFSRQTSECIILDTRQGTVWRKLSESELLSPAGGDQQTPQSGRPSIRYSKCVHFTSTVRLLFSGHHSPMGRIDFGHGDCPLCHSVLNLGVSVNSWASTVWICVIVSLFQLLPWKMSFMSSMSLTYGCPLTGFRLYACACVVPMLVSSTWYSQGWCHLVTIKASASTISINNLPCILQVIPVRTYVYVQRIIGTCKHPPQVIAE